MSTLAIIAISVGAIMASFAIVVGTVNYIAHTASAKLVRQLCSLVDVEHKHDSTLARSIARDDQTVTLAKSISFKVVEGEAFGQWNIVAVYGDDHDQMMVEQIVSGTHDIARRRAVDIARSIAAWVSRKQPRSTISVASYM